MRKTLMLAALFIITIPALASAQSDPTTTSRASSVGQATSQSISGASQSGVSINETTTDSGNYPANQTIRNNTQAPDIVTSGANACALPIGGSTSVLGFGFGFGATPTDKGCERRDNANALNIMGYHAAAVALMCQDDTVAKAMASVGSSCTPGAVSVAQVVQPPSPPSSPSPAPSPAFSAGMSTDQLNAASLIQIEK
jgi:hypothetical protein